MRQLLIVAAAALAVLLAVFVGNFTGGGADAEKAAIVKSPPGTFRPTKEEWAGFKVAPVKLVIFTPEVAAEGHIAIDQDLTTPVFTPYSGRVVKVIARLGERLRKGAPLLDVDSSEVVNATDTLVSQLSKLKTARSKLALAELSEKRQHALYLAKGTALKDWQESQTELAAARNRLSAAEIAVASARQNLRILGSTPQEIAQIEKAPPQNADPVARVRSPIGGTVIARHVGPGEYIRSGGSKPVFTIGNLSTVWLLADVPERDAPAIRVGEPVKVHVIAFPGRVFTAKLTYVAAAIDPDTHRLAVRADVDNPNDELKFGMFANFVIVTGKPVTVPAVPAEAVVYHGRRVQVWVTGRDKTLALREIRVGRSEDGMVEVLSGLKPGESVVTEGSVFIDRAARGEQSSGEGR